MGLNYVDSALFSVLFTNIYNFRKINKLLGVNDKMKGVVGAKHAHHPRNHRHAIHVEKEFRFLIAYPLEASRLSRHSYDDMHWLSFRAKGIAANRQPIPGVRAPRLSPLVAARGSYVLKLVPHHDFLVLAEW